LNELVWLALASGLAGCLDAIVGGGGLILVPALFAVYPLAPPATLFGSNKAAAIWGTAWAASQYCRRVSVNWRSLVPAMGAALGGSFLGAWAVTRMPADGLRKALPLVLFVILAYTLANKQLGRKHSPKLSPAREALWATLIGGVIGAYDGFFGPGTGSFFVFLFVRGLGYDFLHASAAAKLLNTATNLAALAWFASAGHVWWRVAAVLAAANVAGSLLGTGLALRHGTAFVRWVFVAVVGALILKTGWNAYFA
jgi:uncharacterized membrane protein YfcA